MICLKCHHKNRVYANYCNQCGASLEREKDQSENSLGGIVHDLWSFLSSSTLAIVLWFIGVVGLIISLAWPEWMKPSLFFGAAWYTLFFWLLLGLNVIALLGKGLFQAYHLYRKQSFGKLIWRWATSIRLAIVLIALLVVIGLVSTILPQLSFNREIDLITRYGPDEFALLKKLGLTDIFSNWVFLAVVTLFTINLSACTQKRLKASLQYFRLTMRPKLPQAFANMPYSTTLQTTTNSSSNPYGWLANALKAKGYRVREEQGQLLAEKWRWERFAIDVFHVSLLVIIAALAVTNTIGYSILQVNYEGDVFSVPNRDFQVRVDRFWSDNYPGTERVMDWNTQLTILENNQPIKTATIEVNHPFTYQGVSMYQAAMGEDWQGGARVTLQIIRMSDGKDLGEYTVNLGESFYVSEEQIQIKSIAFLTDFALTENNVAYSRSQNLLNPAVYLEVLDENDRFLSRTWSFSRLPELQRLINDDYQFIITGMTAPEFTGLELSWDPGMPVAYLGFFVAVVSLMANFLFKHRQIWIQFDQDSEKFIIGAKVRKGNMADEFANLITQFKHTTKEIVDHAQ